MTIYPPEFRAVRATDDELADRLSTLWRLCTTPEQRHEIEAVADQMNRVTARITEQAQTQVAALEKSEWNDLERDLSSAVEDAVAQVVRDWRRPLKVATLKSKAVAS